MVRCVGPEQAERIAKKSKTGLVLAKPFATIGTAKPFATADVTPRSRRYRHARTGLLSADGRRARDSADSLGTGAEPSARDSCTARRGQGDELLDLGEDALGDADQGAGQTRRGSAAPHLSRGRDARPCC